MQIDNFNIRVRAVLGDDSGAIPDEIIALPEYQGAAERFVAGFADYGTLPEEKKAVYESAVIFKAVLLLLPYFRKQLMKVEQSPQGKFERYELDWAMEEEKLASWLDEALAALNEQFAASLSGMTIFTVTNPRRGCGA